MTTPTMNAVTFEVIRNRLVAIAEEMRIALQSVSGSPTVTEASDFFTGLFRDDGSVVSMGFQVSFQAPVSGTVIRHIRSKPELKVRDGDMFIGNDPFIGALHQNDVQMIGPIYAGDKIIAWAGVQAHHTDVGGMDFASWCPKAKSVFQEGIRIPCVKLMDRGELREDVLEMITTASRLPDALGLDIRAFIATINVARNRVTDLVGRYGAELIQQAMQRMIDSSNARMRARLAQIPDGEYHAHDFLEHDGHNNELYKIDVRITKHGEKLKLDYSGSSKQSPGFVNATRAGLMGGVAGSLLTTLGWDIQWNQGILDAAEVIAPDGLICTTLYPAPVGAATVEAIWGSLKRHHDGLEQDAQRFPGLQTSRADRERRLHGDLQPWRYQSVRRALRLAFNGSDRRRFGRLVHQGWRGCRRADHIAGVLDRRHRAKRTGLALVLPAQAHGLRHRRCGKVPRWRNRGGGPDAGGD